MDKSEGFSPNGWRGRQKTATMRWRAVAELSERVRHGQKPAECNSYGAESVWCANRGLAARGNAPRMQKDWHVFHMQKMPGKCIVVRRRRDGWFRFGCVPLGASIRMAVERTFMPYGQRRVRAAATVADDAMLRSVLHLFARAAHIFCIGFFRCSPSVFVFPLLCTAPDPHLAGRWCYRCANLHGACLHCTETRRYAMQCRP